MRHLGNRDGFVVAGVSGLSELRHAQGHDFLHGVARWLQIVTRIELLRRLSKYLADGASDRQAIVRINVDLADAIADTQLDFFDRYAPRWLQLAAKLVDDVLQIL